MPASLIAVSSLRIGNGANSGSSLKYNLMERVDQPADPYGVAYMSVIASGIDTSFRHQTSISIMLGSPRIPLDGYKL